MHVPLCHQIRELTSLSSDSCYCLKFRPDVECHLHRCNNSLLLAIHQSLFKSRQSELTLHEGTLHMFSNMHGQVLPTVSHYYFCCFVSPVVTVALLSCSDYRQTEFGVSQTPPLTFSRKQALWNLYNRPAIIV